MQIALKCKLHLTTPAREPKKNRTHNPPIPGASARTTRQLPKTSSNNKSRKKPRVFAPRPRRSPQSVTRTPQKSQKNLEFLHLGHANPRRGSREQVKHRKKPWIFAPRPRRFPQRVTRTPQKSQKTPEFLHLDHANPRRRSRKQVKNRKKPWVFAPRPRQFPQRIARAS